MKEIVFLPVLVVLTVSYALVLLAAKNRRSPLVEDYLYSGNRPLFAVSSGLGTVLSVSIAFTALLSGGYVFGWQILFSIIPGAATGLLLLLKVTRSTSVRSAADAAGPEGAGTSPASYLTMLTNPKQAASTTFLLGVPVVVYWLFMVMEFSVVRVTMKSLFALGNAEVLALLVLIAVVCFFYIFVGGYLGVLLTDHFQLLVILGFLASVFLRFVHQLDFPGLPTPLTSYLEWPSTLHLTLLHIGTFVASMSIILASPDNWIRTIGTLRLRKARLVLILITVVACIATAVPVLIGSSIHLEDTTPAGLGGELSLRLMRLTVAEESSGLSFLFIMALSCVVMTTIDTYAMTGQQLYYELTRSLHSGGHKSYLLEYCLKWKQVRLVGFFQLLTALVISLWIPSKFIYVFGVGSLSLMIILVPLPLSLLQSGDSLFSLRGRPAAVGLGLSMALSPILMCTAHRWLISVHAHLYMLPVAATLASVVGYGGTAIVLYCHAMRRR